MLKLYTTSHCHLCETALALISQQCASQQIELIEIAHDEILLNRYGTRIPVLQRTDTMCELNWPFDASKLQSFLAL